MPVIHDVIAYRGQTLDEVVDVSAPGGRYDLVHGHVTAVIAVRDILGDARVKQNGFLRDDADLWAQPLQIQRAYVLVVKCLQQATSGYCLDVRRWMAVDRVVYMYACIMCMIRRTTWPWIGSYICMHVLCVWSDAPLGRGSGRRSARWAGWWCSCRSRWSLPEPGADRAARRCSAPAAQAHSAATGTGTAPP